MQSLKIKTKTHLFNFRLSDYSNVYLEKKKLESKDNCSLVKFIPASSCVNEEVRMEEFLNQGDDYIVLFIRDEDLIEEISDFAFLAQFEGAPGINFVDLSADQIDFLEYQEEFRNQSDFAKIYIKVSELLDLSLNGESML